MSIISSINPCTFTTQLDFRYFCSTPSHCLLSEQHSNELKTINQAAGSRKSGYLGVKVEPEAPVGPRFQALARALQFRLGFD
jgi:hypothetical protein